MGSQSDDQHYVRQEIPPRQGLKPCHSNEQNTASPLYIKLGEMKKLVKATDWEDRWFAFLLEKFPQINMEKLKASISDVPEIKKKTWIS